MSGEYVDISKKTTGAGPYGYPDEKIGFGRTQDGGAVFFVDYSSSGGEHCTRAIGLSVPIEGIKIRKSYRDQDFAAQMTVDRRAAYAASMTECEGMSYSEALSVFGEKSDSLTISEI